MGFADKDIDLKDTTYKPINNQDQENYDICKSLRSILEPWETNPLLDDPILWDKAPISLQLVARNLEDEKLLAIGKVIDKAINFE